MSLRSRGTFLLLLTVISLSLCSCASLTPSSSPKVSAPIPTGSPAPSAIKPVPDLSAPISEAPLAPSAIKPIPDEKVVKNNFSRTYSVDFMSFYPKLHSALQDYARRNKGNSFQVVRLGSKEVIFRGRYREEGDQERFLTVITAKPMGPKETLMEVRISPNNAGTASAFLEKAANALFQIFEKGSDHGK